VTGVDWVALGLVALAALVGLRKGLIGSALSLAGILGGALLGARLAPHLLTDGASSPYAPIVALVGAIVGAFALQVAASAAASAVRGGLRLTPFGPLDSIGGLVLGAAAGLAVIWVVGAVALLLPDRTDVRRYAQQSEVLKRLNEIASPRSILNLLARVDPFPSILGPAPPNEAPTPAIVRDPEVRSATTSVVRIVGTSCGLGVVGSGWVAGSELVVTAAHVVAGQKDTVVEVPGSARRLPAEAFAFDARNDIAVLRVRGLRARPLALVDPTSGEAVAIVGYPGNGPLTSTPGRVGRTATVLTEDAYGKGPVSRTITAIGGAVRNGNSGGPAIDGGGRVQGTIFAARSGSESGYAVPAELVRDLLADARAPVSTGACTG
jgi:S1-C subfamily serine protease